MTDYYDETRQESREINEDTPRRRSTDLPQPLDYPTRELVRDIIEDKPRERVARKSLLQRLFGLGRAGKLQDCCRSERFGPGGGAMAPAGSGIDLVGGIVRPRLARSG